MKYSRANLHKRFLNGIANLFYLQAFADGETSNSDTGENPPFDLGKLLAQARQEEKEKLYPEIQRLKSENSLLQKQANDAIMEAGKVKQELEELRKNQGNASNEEITKLQAKVEALTEENKKLKESSPKEDEIRKQIEAEYELKAYLREKLEENKGRILSVYAKQVKGKTKEEIDAAIKKAIEDSDEIRKEVNGGVDSPSDSEDDGKKKKKKPNNNNRNDTEVPPAPNPSINVGDKEFTLDYIQGLDPRSKEYAEFRKQIGLKK